MIRLGRLFSEDPFLATGIDVAGLLIGIVAGLYYAKRSK
jgi:hypothetical protein